MRMRTGTSPLLVLGFAAALSAATVNGPTLTIDASAGKHPISNDIYGMNSYSVDAAFATEIKLPVSRWGGNATTRYNYLLDSSNSGSDWYFQGGDGNANPVPSAGADQFHSTNKSNGSKSILTVPVIGWVNKLSAINCSYPQSVWPNQAYYDPYGHGCGNGVDKTTNQQIADTIVTSNNLAVDSTWMTGWLQHLIAKFGNAASGGVQIYQMDNEPSGWGGTHFDIHPGNTGYDELVNKTIPYAAMVKATDPTALVLGPGDFGYSAYIGMGVPGDDATSHGVGMAEYYLQKMAAYQQAHGVRILDYFDEHYYPTTNNGVGCLALCAAGDATTQALRLESTRSLWDPTYRENNWIGIYFGAIRLIPQFRDWVNRDYPGTKIAVTEYNFGGLESINGALTQADVLGIFGREALDLATMWGPPTATQPGSYAFRIFRNYDGHGSQFGDGSVSSVSANQSQLSIYGAVRSSDGALTLVAINKTANDLSSSLSLANFTPGNTAQVYQYSSANLNAIVRGADLPVTASGFPYTYPAYSITLFVIPAGSGTPPQVAAPTFNPPAGTYTGTQQITISSATSGASIRYTLDNSTPTASTGTAYNGSVSIAASATLKAIAYKTGMTDSTVTSGAYTINPPPQVAAPTFNPPAGTYTGTQQITISSATSGASIRYTLDGTAPSSSTGTLYTAAVTVAASATLRAIAYKTGMTDSTVTSGAYVITTPPVQVAAPTFNPPPGSYSSAQQVTLASLTSGASIRYTTDGSTPTSTTGTIYNNTAVPIASTATLKAIAYKAGMTDSTVTSGTYTITISPTQVAAPVFSPTPGVYTSAQPVTISSTTTGASIRYTTDGTTPTSTSGTPYAGPVTVASNLTLKAIAYKTGLTDSNVTSGLYAIVPPTLRVNRTVLNYGVTGSVITSPQRVYVISTPGLSWTASSSQPNITLSHTSGTGIGTFLVTATAGPSGTITVSASGVPNATITVNIVTNSAPTPPFGFVDTPVDNSAEEGAFAVTGWALDAVEVTRVSIWRDRVAADAPTAPDPGPGPQAGLVFIGNAIFLPDTRPDVAAAYPNTPLNYRAGWGMMLLSNTMPNNDATVGAGGNGTFKLHAIATNKLGISVELAAHTVRIDNRHGTRPFGTIDTPGQGDTISGTQYVNFAWALTQSGYMIPTDASTMRVFIDGAPVAHPAYNFPRADIQSLFPGYSNTDGAIGFFTLDTTTLADGLHSIAWSVSDNAGRNEGIGSRVFYVQNGAPLTSAPPVVLETGRASKQHGGVRARLGFRPDAALFPVPLGPDGYVLNAPPGGRIELHLDTPVLSELDFGLPGGARLERESGVLYWQPAIGTKGEFPMTFQTPSGERKVTFRIGLSEE